MGLFSSTKNHFDNVLFEAFVTVNRPMHYLPSMGSFAGFDSALCFSKQCSRRSWTIDATVLTSKFLTQNHNPWRKLCSSQSPSSPAANFKFNGSDEPAGIAAAGRSMIGLLSLLRHLRILLWECRGLSVCLAGWLSLPLSLSLSLSLKHFAWSLYFICSLWLWLFLLQWSLLATKCTIILVKTVMHDSLFSLLKSVNMDSFITAHSW